ncbi:MAG TPA: hypothetical protein DCG49_05455 [Ruminococcus sp.]|nr:hypothetical protein [Ruminococcus sp.]
MLRKKKLLIFYLAAGFLAAVLFWLYAHLSAAMPAQNTADRWAAGSERFSQISVFFPADLADAGTETVSSLEAYINEMIGVKAEDSESRPWVDAYSSAEIPVQAAKYDDSDTVQANVIGVSGDYFLFHPLELADGSYLYQDALRRNSAVLDENAAWSIFFSLDVTGMRFKIGEKEFVVQGVVREDDQKETQEMCSGDARIYLPYDALSDITDDAALLCYEVLIPAPIRHYARNLLLDYYRGDCLDETKSAETDGKIPVEIVDNTERFSYASVFQHLLQYRQCGIATRAIAYPYWENAARMLLNRLSLILVLILLVTGSLIGVTARLLIRKYRNRTFHLKSLTDKLIVRFTYKNSV